MSNKFSQEDITRGLLSLVAWAGNASKAARALKADGKLDVAAPTLTAWARESHAIEYQELREKYADQLEQQLVAEQRDVMRLGLDVERRGLEKALGRLESGADKDPSRTASNASAVVDRMGRSMMMLQGRPQVIKEERSFDQILKGLAERAPGLFVDWPGQVEDGKPEEISESTGEPSSE